MRRALAIAAPVVAVGLVVLAAVLERSPGALVFAPLAATFTAVGAVLWHRRVNAVMAALFVFSGLVVAVSVLTEAVAHEAIAHHAAQAPWAAWAFQASLALSIALFLVVQLFPTGRPLTPRWRWLIAATVGVAAAQFVSNAFGVTPEFRTNFPGLRHPLTLLPSGITGALDDIGGVGDGLVFLASAVSVVVRFRRSGGEERLQMKWFTLAAAVAAVGFGIGLAVDPNGPVTVFAVLTPLVPLAAGVAILRYHLYDIDIVITKTVIVTALAAFIAVVYVAVVVGLGSLLGSRNSPGLSIAATIAIALLFAPVRSAVRGFANRLVYGDRATPYEVMAGFSRRVAGTLSVEEVLPGMAQAAATGVGATMARVRVSLPAGEDVERWPVEAPDPEAFDLSLEVRYHGEPVGGIDVTKPANEPLRPAERDLLEDLAAQAGLALHNVRLADELAIRTAELEEQTRRLAASRQRLVAARDEQRRRLEREIREGPAARLTEIRDELGNVAELAIERSGRAGDLLDDLGRRANATLEQLRDLARGIFPPLLIDRGLVAALEAHVRKVGANARIQATPSFTAGRFDAEIEACIYFCCLQAVQNVIRHAANASTVVRLDAVGGGVLFEVEDEGPGFDVGSTPGGAGRAIIRDRLEALEGTLEITSRPGVGTTVRGLIPLERATAGLGGDAMVKAAVP
jgi:signal transduction histidine kinase